MSPAESPAVAGQKIIATKMYRTESPPNFIYSNGNGKILIKPTNEMKWTKMVFATKFGFGSRLSKGKVLAPLTSIVLDETHLVVSQSSVSLSLRLFNQEKEHVFLVFNCGGKR